MKIPRPYDVPSTPTVITTDCLEKMGYLKWCLSYNPSPKLCEPILKDISLCYAKAYDHNFVYLF
jgi:hypothetical protein